MGIKVPKTNYEAMWERMIERVGRAEAGEAIFDYVLYSANDRLKKLLNLARDGEQVKIRVKDIKIIHNIFWGNGYPRKVGEYLIEYMEETDFEWEHIKPKPDQQVELISKEEFKWDVALSFAGEDREIAKKLKNALEYVGIKVFYDRSYKHELWGKDLTLYFKESYGWKSRYVIPLISKNYPIKDWTNYEFSIARDEAKRRKKEFILPVRLDDTIILGLPNKIGYIDYRNEGINGIVEILMNKLSIKKGGNVKDLESDVNWYLKESKNADKTVDNGEYRKKMNNIHDSGTAHTIKKWLKRRK